jgi:palmitoyl transferase
MLTVRSATQPGGSRLHGGWLLSAAVAWLAVGTTSPALAQPVDKPSGSRVRVQVTTPAAVSPGDGDTTGFWRRTAEGIKKVWSNGRSDLFVPGYIWHAPWQYSGEQRARYNTVAWGIGYGRTMVDAAGRSRTLFGMVSADSYDHLQYMAGYAWRAHWRPGNGPLKLGAGYTALVIGRSDPLSYAPVPLALPLVSLGTNRFEIIGAYVPGYEVGYFFARVSANRRQTVESSR